MSLEPAGDSPYWDESIETLPRPALRAVQLARLQWQVRRCWDGLSFYRERLRAAGLGPDDIEGLDDLQRLPVLTSAELSDARRSDLLERGRSEADEQNEVSAAARALWALHLRPTDLLECDSLPGSAASCILARKAAERIGATHVEADRLRHRRSVRDEPSRSGSPLVMALHTGAARLAWFEMQEGADVDSLRRKIKDEFGWPAFAFYSSPDVGPILSWECYELDGLHWSEDHYLLEILDPTTRQLTDGATGVLVLSQISREAGPLLRYWTGHQARLTSEPCGCGRTHARTDFSSR